MKFAAIKNYTHDPYKTFFCFVGGLFLAIILGAVGILMFNDTAHGNPYIIYPMASLGTVVVMMNLGDQSPSAKEVFWGWIFVTFGFAAISGIGAGIIYSYVYYVG